MARANDVPSVDSYSSTVRKVLVVDGSGSVVSSKTNMILYTDATYEYVCEANGSGVALNSANWRVTRIRSADAYMQFSSNYDSYGDLATDLTVVQGLSYS